MASNLYPQGMTLHTIGYAALKHPSLPPELPVPLGNQLGVLQRIPLSSQIRIMAHVASQYLPSLLTYLYSDAPHLHDPSSSQYWFSDTFALINWLISNPDIAIRVAQHPSLLHDTIEKLLKDDVEEKMKGCSRTGGATFDADFGSMLQFVSTILLQKEHLQDPVHPRVKELVPKLKAWKRKYKGAFIGKVSDRLADQIEKPNELELEMVREGQRNHLVCGFVGCDSKKDLSLCGKCKMVRYCSTGHQKKDWSFHKTICDKGLVEEE